MDSDNLSSTCELQENQHRSIKSDSFVVDMERSSHLTDKDVTANSRITLQRSLSRKGSNRGGDKKIDPTSAGHDKDPAVFSISPRAATSTPEKPMVVTVGTTNHPSTPQVHHQITIMAGNISGASAATPTTESKSCGKRFIFRRSSPSSSSWAIDPRRILFFFATLSSMGTILLIYFTLSMGKLSGDDDNALNW